MKSLFIRPYRLSFPDSLPNYIQCPYRADVNKESVIEECLTYLVHLTRMVFVMGSKWLHSCSFVWCVLV